MIFISYIVEGKKTTPSVGAAALLTCAGSTLVVLHNPSFDLAGVFLVLTSLVAAAFQYAAASLTMKGNTSLVFHTTMYTALVVCFFCLPLILILELDRFHAFVRTNSLLQCLGMLLVGGSMATAYLLVINGLIAIGGTVYLTVLGNAKLAIVVLVSCYVFEEKLTRLNIVGICITIVGFWLFSLAKQRQKRKEKLQEELRKIYEEEDGDDEENQSLLGNPNSMSGDHRGPETVKNEREEEEHTRQLPLALLVSTAMVVFVISLAVALVCIGVAGGAADNCNQGFVFTTLEGLIVLHGAFGGWAGYSCLSKGRFLNETHFKKPVVIIVATLNKVIALNWRMTGIAVLQRTKDKISVIFILSNELVCSAPLRR